MKSPEIRQKFFDFFVKHHHEKVASSSLIPAQDPTLLFANAGMNQFKDIFLGKEKRNYTRAVSIQKCVRAGGKHNDLDQVGFTKRHLTFFEMMGNFSFGDYFKKEAIQFAWDFLTREMKLPVNRLYVTVFREDDQAFTIWHNDIGLAKERISRLDEADNFWQMGDTGPCGPCSEIYIDQGVDLGCKQPTCAPGCPCDRFLEIWNLVFMQFDKQADGTNKPLKQTGVDTGMGLERLCVVMQNKNSIFHTDLFEPILHTIEKLTGLVYEKQSEKVKAAFHVLADHIRSSALIIADGCAPSNEGRGYVLRKIIRRAALFAQKISDQNIFPELVKPFVEKLGGYYPELVTNQEKIKQLLTSEIEKFSVNLIRGQHILDSYCAQAKDKTISGEQAFKLYDTYGFPLELIIIASQERGFNVDLDGFHKHMAEQQQRSGKKEETQQAIELPEQIKTEFTGYQELATQGKITALIHDDNVVDQVEAHAPCWIITDRSPFYVEGGGQISDQGFIEVGGHKTPVLALKKFNGAIGTKISTSAALKVGMPVLQIVNDQRRTNTMKNHTATHLLQAALIKILGNTVKQSGSLVEPNYLRFDFTYHENLSPETIKQVETIVNHIIMENIPVKVTHTTYQDAINKGVIAFFGEKYNPAQVRIIEVPGFSAELCGGTHVRATGDIGVFKITELSALSAGTRRLVAVTGPAAVELFQENFGTVKALSQEFKVQPHEVLSAVHKQKEQLKELLTQIKQLKKQLMQLELPSLLDSIEHIGAMPFLLLDLPNYSSEELREMATLLQKNKPGCYFLVSSTDGKSNFFVSLAPDYQKNLNLKLLQQWMQEKLGLRSGGAQGTLQGGGPHFEELWKEQIRQWIEQNQ